jgi:hypothetical protein
MRCSKLTMVLRFALVAALAAALVSARPAAAARSSTMDPLLPCYVAAQQDQTQPVNINAHGFTPYALIDVYLDDVLQPVSDPPAQADVNGDVRGSIAAPYVQFGVRRFTVRLAEHITQANPVVQASRVANLSVQQLPTRAATSAHVRFKGQGFTEPGWVWAHYVYAGKSRKTVRMARPTGECGQFSRRIRQFPFKHSPKVGSWTIQFDQQRKYDPKAPVLARLTIKVNRAIKPKT